MFTTFLFLLHRAVMNKLNLSPLALRKDTEIQWNHTPEAKTFVTGLSFIPLENFQVCFSNVIFSVWDFFFLSFSKHKSKKLLQFTLEDPKVPGLLGASGTPEHLHKGYGSWFQRRFHPPLKHSISTVKKHQLPWQQNKAQDRTLRLPVRKDSCQIQKS